MTDIEKLKELEAKATRGRWKVFATEREFVGGHTRQVYQIRTEKRHPQLKDHYPVVCECEQNLKDGQKHGIWLSKDDSAFIVAVRNALPALLASLASKDAEIEELRVRLDRSRDEYHRKIDHDLMRARAERDEWKEACRRAGVCMSCATSNRDPMGCTDCMNTGWDGGSPMEARMAEDRADSAESRLTTALAALGEAKSGLVEIEAITPHKATRLCARAALPLIAAELAGVARDPKLIDQVSRGLAAGWRGNPNMSGDDRDFMHPSMRRRHNEKSADACEFIALAIEAHARKMGEA